VHVRARTWGRGPTSRRVRGFVSVLPYAARFERGFSVQHAAPVRALTKRATTSHTPIGYSAARRAPSVTASSRVVEGDPCAHDPARFVPGTAKKAYPPPQSLALAPTRVKNFRFPPLLLILMPCPGIKPFFRFNSTIIKATYFLGSYITCM
jgi:hypothetical protein